MCTNKLSVTLCSIAGIVGKIYVKKLDIQGLKELPLL